MNLSKTKKSIGIFLVLFFFGIGFSVYAQSNSSSSEGVFADFDQDGLSNDEEVVYGTDPNNKDSDGDGYSDGTEVQSGYDPLKPAPGDKIVQEKAKTSVDGNEENKEDENDANLTQEIAKKISEMISDSNNNEEDIATIDDINMLVEGALSENSAFDDLDEIEEIDESSIKIKKQNYSEFSEEKQARKKKEDNEKYVTAVYYLAVENSPYKITKPDDLGGFEDEIISKISSLSSLEGVSSKMEYFENMAEKGDNFLTQFEKIEVPEDMVEMHKKGLKLLNKAITLKENVEINPDDPIGSIVSLGKAQNMLALFADFQNEISGKMNELGLDQIEEIGLGI
ncbi:MAG: thrombospondin type 3 repeat-containing protein [Candidatus Moranbacteria bacterium]|nr:thrombospondin type 3 repeat-containing protein [Candidatus Moranbacteria bacterium]